MNKVRKKLDATKKTISLRSATVGFKAACGGQLNSTAIRVQPNMSAVMPAYQPRLSS